MCFQISPEWCGRRTFDAFSEWKVDEALGSIDKRWCRFKLHRQFQYSSIYFDLFNNLSSVVHFSQRQGLISYHRGRNRCRENSHFMIIDLKSIVKQFDVKFSCNSHCFACYSSVLRHSCCIVALPHSPSRDFHMHVNFFAVFCKTTLWKSLFSAFSLFEAIKNSARSVKPADSANKSHLISTFLC